MIADSPTLDDIRRQPQLLTGLLARLPELQRFAQASLQPDPGGCLHAYGCGDGQFAARAAQPALCQQAGLAYQPHTALEMQLYQAPQLSPADRVLAISMSGNVDRGVAAAQASREAGAPVALLCNGQGGRLGQQADARFDLAIPSLATFLCGTSSYTATLASLLLAFAIPPAALEPLSNELDRTIDYHHRHLMGIATRLGSQLPGVRLLAAGPHLASAEYGAAKLVELSRLPVWYDDLEEFAHRQFWSATAGELVVFLCPNPTLASLASDSAEALNAMGFHTLSLEIAGAPVPQAQHRLALPEVAESLAGLVFAPSLQLLAYHLARATGFDPDTRAHLRQDELRFNTSRQLTRRSLLGTGQ